MGDGQRGCGYKKVGGIYLTGHGIPYACDRMPFEIINCTCCGSGIKQSRGVQWINWSRYAGKHEDCDCIEQCFICHPQDEKYALMWVGKKYYSAESFTNEALKMGVSKRIAQIPNELELGKTIVLLAHPEAIAKYIDDPTTLSGQRLTRTAGVFYAFIPDKIQKVITKDEATKENLLKLKKRKITPLIATKIEGDNAIETEEMLLDDLVDDEFSSSLVNNLDEYMRL